MLTEMNTDQMYVVDAFFFLIPYRARFVLLFSPIFFFPPLHPFLGLVECACNGFSAFAISCYILMGTAECIPFPEGDGGGGVKWAFEDGETRGTKHDKIQKKKKNNMG